MLSLPKRACLLGATMSSKTKIVKSVKLRLLRDPHSWDWHFQEVNRELVPRQTCYKSHELARPIPSAFVGVYFAAIGSPVEVEFTECKLSKIKLAPMEGGDTVLSCKVTTPPILDETLPQLFRQFGEVVEIEIRGEPPGAQRDLPLNSVGGQENPHSDRPAFWGAGRKPEGAH